MKHEEIVQLADYLDKVAQRIPRGLADLKDAVTFVIFDLRTYTRTQIRLRSYTKALTFAQKIPQVADLQSEEFTEWMLNTTDHLEYLKHTEKDL